MLQEHKRWLVFSFWQVPALWDSSPDLEFSAPLLVLRTPRVRFVPDNFTYIFRLAGWDGLLRQESLVLQSRILTSPLERAWGRSGKEKAERGSHKKWSEGKRYYITYCNIQYNVHKMVGQPRIWSENFLQDFITELSQYLTSMDYGCDAGVDSDSEFSCQWFAFVHVVLLDGDRWPTTLLPDFQNTCSQLPVFQKKWGSKEV